MRKAIAYGEIPIAAIHARRHVAQAFVAVCMHARSISRGAVKPHRYRNRFSGALWVEQGVARVAGIGTIPEAGEACFTDA